MVQLLYDLFIGILKNCLKFYNLRNKLGLGGFKANNQVFWKCLFSKLETKVIFCYYTT